MQPHEGTSAESQHSSYNENPQHDPQVNPYQTEQPVLRMNPSLHDDNFLARAPDLCTLTESISSSYMKGKG